VARRQIRLVVADRGYFAFLALLPFILGRASHWSCPAMRAWAWPTRRGDDPNEPAQIITLLNISAVFMGTALNDS